MLILANPWLLLLLPLPLFVWWLAPAHREARRGLVVPFLSRLAKQTGSAPSEGSIVPRGTWWRWLMVCLCWACVVVALARPQLVEPSLTKEVPMRDLLLAVDLSGSMETKDFTNAKGQTVDRLTAVKEVLDDFLSKRKGDRVGLIFFGSAPFVQVPFTEDLKVCRQLLDEAQVKMAGPQTAFGDALGLAINLFDRSNTKDRVLIALTDGNDTASQVPPAKAAQIAKDKGIVIHTVAVGDPKAAGEDALDVATLKEVATTTGGQFSHATDRKQLDDIYRQLDKLESQKVQTITHRPRRDVYWWALAAALVISLLQLSLGLLSHRMGRSGGMESLPAALALPGLVAASALLIHFIRPEWLFALIPATLLWWALRRQTDPMQPWRGHVAPHLLRHLLSGKESKSRFGPLDLVGAIWLLAIVAIAGPTWKHEPAPFADDTAALAIVVKVSPSMETEDVQPSRLARATQKIHDLLQQRRGAKTSLIAYAGTAHVVMPATTDAGIIDSFAQSLDPKIMPVDGDASAQALQLADQTLADAGGGSILWITDGIAPEQAASISNWRKNSGTEVRLFPPLLPGAERDSVKKAARAAKAESISLTADDTDVCEVASAAKFANVSGDDSNNRWAESGYWLTPLIAVLLLPFFRKGWMIFLGGTR